MNPTHNESISLTWANIHSDKYNCQKPKPSDNLIQINVQMLEAVVWRCSVKKVFLEISQNSQKNTCASLFFNKVAGRPATLLKKRLWHWCFPVNFVKFLRKPFFTEHI